MQEIAHKSFFRTTQHKPSDNNSCPDPPISPFLLQYIRSTTLFGNSTSIRSIDSGCGDHGGGGTNNGGGSSGARDLGSSSPGRDISALGHTVAQLKDSGALQNVEGLADVAVPCRATSFATKLEIAATTKIDSADDSPFQRSIQEDDISFLCRRQGQPHV